MRHSPSWAWYQDCRQAWRTRSSARGSSPERLSPRRRSGVVGSSSTASRSGVRLTKSRKSRSRRHFIRRITAQCAGDPRRAITPRRLLAHSLVRSHPRIRDPRGTWPSPEEWKVTPRLHAKLVGECDFPEIRSRGRQYLQSRETSSREDNYGAAIPWENRRKSQDWSAKILKNKCWTRKCVKIIYLCIKK